MAKEHDHPGTNKNVHPPVVALIFIAIAYFLGRFIPLPLVVSAAWQYFGLLLTLVGVLLGMAAFAEFRKAQTTLDPHGSTKQIVTSGIYRFSRNPIYLGFLLMVIGVPLNSGFVWGIFMAPLYIILLTRLVIEPEEAYLEKKFKEQYAGYRTRVRRWL